MAENGLDLSFDVDYEEDEEGIELEETSSSDSDNDEGDLGDLDLEEDNNFAAGDLVGLGVREKEQPPVELRRTNMSPSRDMHQTCQTMNMMMKCGRGGMEI